MLSHPVFRNSVCCPKLLLYVVEYIQDSNSAPLKERFAIVRHPLRGAIFFSPPI
jgi:hypothetical protein